MESCKIYSAVIEKQNFKHTPTLFNLSQVSPKHRAIATDRQLHNGFRAYSTHAGYVRCRRSRSHPHRSFHHCHSAPSSAEFERERRANTYTTRGEREPFISYTGGRIAALPRPDASDDDLLPPREPLHSSVRSDIASLSPDSKVREGRTVRLKKWCVFHKVARTTVFR